MKMKGPATTLALFCAIVSETAAQTLLSDSFSGSSLNSASWTASVPFSDSSATVSGGALSLANGAGIISANTYATPIEISFSFAFTGTTHDSFRVYTRADGFNPNGYALTHGVGVSFRIQEDTGNLSGNIALEENGGTLSAGTFALAAASFYDVRLVDTGSALALFLNGSTTPFLTASTSSIYGNYIGAFNREGGGNNSWISAGSISSLDYITVTAVPEPSSYATALGALTLGFVMLRRHRNHTFNLSPPQSRPVAPTTAPKFRQWCGSMRFLFGCASLAEFDPRTLRDILRLYWSLDKDCGC